MFFTQNIESYCFARDNFAVIRYFPQSYPQKLCATRLSFQELVAYTIILCRLSTIHANWVPKTYPIFQVYAQCWCNDDSVTISVKKTLLL